MACERIDGNVPKGINHKITFFLEDGMVMDVPKDNRIVSTEPKSHPPDVEVRENTLRQRVVVPTEVAEANLVVGWIEDGKIENASITVKHVTDNETKRPMAIVIKRQGFSRQTRKMQIQRESTQDFVHSAFPLSTKKQLHFHYEE